MKTHKNLYQRLCSEENIALAFQKAQKRKSRKPYVIEYKVNLNENLEALRHQLTEETYNPKPLRTFVIRDPKTRKIRKSYFVDRIVHHAICNILEPIYEKLFIYDSFANRKGRGALKALQRFDIFKRKVSKNNTRNCYILKADIRHYFDEVNHNTLINILNKKISDNKLMKLIWKVLNNHSENVGMPLGNMTSQFFANVYLNELDQFVKHELKAKYYIRYVDDFVILHHDKVTLEGYREKIDVFLKENLQLQLHPTKSKILLLERGIAFLGFRNFFYHKLLRKSNIFRMKEKIVKAISFDFLCKSLQGWMAYTMQANTYKLRNKLTNLIEFLFPGDISFLELDRLIKIWRG